MRETPAPQPHETVVEQARHFLLQYGFTEETLSAMDGAELIAEMTHQYQHLLGALRPSVRLLDTQRCMLYLTPLRWGWVDITMYGWRLLHKGPFFLIYLSVEDEEA